ncbi:MAG TPA: helix-turn-helix domain-containing protein [Mycobacteriales bacterium]|nr:helix-turn-helix domain-containing protein [Mycobacteriales bacterium]
MQLASLRGLLALSLVLISELDENHIIELATTASVSLAHAQTVAVYLDGRRLEPPGGSPYEPGHALDRQVAGLTAAGGAVTAARHSWAWAYPLTGQQGAFGFFVMAAAKAPDEHEQFLLRALVQEAGIAIGVARLHAMERAVAEQLRVANMQLEQSLDALTRNMAMHRTLTQVALSGTGDRGVAEALNQLTGHSVIIEDLAGRLGVWIGPGQPDPYPSTQTRTRERDISRLLRAAGALPVDRGLAALARARAEPLGVITLVGAASPVDDFERVALEYAATVLSIELMRARSITETELRLGGDLADLLVTGTTLAAVRSRVEAVGVDPSALQVVVVVEGRTRRGDDETFFQAVRQAAVDCDLACLVGQREGLVVLVCSTGQPWRDLRDAALAKMPGGRCRVGVGGPCEGIPELPRSYREAQLGLRLQRDSDVGGVTVFDELGLYRLVGAGDTAAAERIVRQWLGALIDYDQQRSTDLTLTLSVYLDSGGHQERAATALSVHQSTLKYRLQRIRELSGCDLRDPEVRFNLQIAARTWRTLQEIRDL